MKALLRLLETHDELAACALGLATFAAILLTLAA